MEGKDSKIIEDEIVLNQKVSFREMQRKEYTCMYCGKVFPTKGHLGWHLPRCKERAVRRDFIVGGRVFMVFLNPRKDILATLKNLANVYNKTLKTNAIKEHRFIGALEALQYDRGYVTTFYIKDYHTGVELYYPIKPPIGEESHKHYKDLMEIYKEDTSKLIEGVDTTKQTTLQ